MDVVYRRRAQGKTADKKMRLIKAALERYNTLISEEEVRISSVGYIVTIKTNGWNVSNCRVTECRSEKSAGKKMRLIKAALKEGYKHSDFRGGSLHLKSWEYNTDQD